METVIVVGPVDWYCLDKDLSVYYRYCDLCNETACEDIWAGKDEPDWRGFWRQRGGANDGLNVCENCLGSFLSEPLE